MLLNKSTVKRKASGENNKVGVEMELETEGNEHLPNRQAALSLHSSLLRPASIKAALRLRPINP